MRKDQYSIGDFSRMSRLSVKALRLYDEQGILKPGHTDPGSGYRYYSSAQLMEAELIRRLRSLELPLQEIKRFLREQDSVARKALLSEHRAKIASRKEVYDSIIDSLESLLDGKEEILERKIEIKELGDQPVLGVRFRTSMPEIGENIGKAYQALFTYLGKLGEFPSGPPFAVYHDKEYKEEDADVEACVPMARLLPGEGDVSSSELPGGRMASTLHIGPFDTIGDTYGDLMMWISENGYDMAGPCREIYLVGPEQAESPADYRTEILCPVEESKS